MNNHFSSTYLCRYPQFLEGLPLSINNEVKDNSYTTKTKNVDKSKKKVGKKDGKGVKDAHPPDDDEGEEELPVKGDEVTTHTIFCFNIIRHLHKKN
jgi:hypothetical protein